jgi:hypothetical protein
LADVEPLLVEVIADAAGIEVWPLTRARVVSVGPSQICLMVRDGRFEHKG